MKASEQMNRLGMESSSPGSAQRILWCLIAGPARVPTRSIEKFPESDTRMYLLARSKCLAAAHETATSSSHRSKDIRLGSLSVPLTQEQVSVTKDCLRAPIAGVSPFRDSSLPACEPGTPTMNPINIVFDSSIQDAKVSP
jgi:hypothetical protein